MNYIFDNKYYLEKYPDVAQSAFKNNPIRHWNKYGKFENRYICKNQELDSKNNVNIRYYKNLNLEDINAENINILCSDDNLINYNNCDLSYYYFDIIMCKKLETLDYKLKNRYLNIKSNSEKINEKVNDIFNIKYSKKTKNLIFIIFCNSKDNLKFLLKSLKNLKFKLLIISKNDEDYNDLKRIYKENDYLISKNLSKAFKFIKTNDFNFDWLYFLNSESILSKNLLNELSNLNIKTDCILYRIFKNDIIIPEINKFMFSKNYNYPSFAIRKKLFTENKINFNSSKSKFYDFLYEIYKKNIEIYVSSFIINSNKNTQKLKLTNFKINDNLFKLKLKIEKKLYYHVINLDTEKDKLIKSKIEYSKLKLFENNLEKFDAIKPSLDSVLKNKIINVNKFWEFTNLQDINNVKYCIGASGCKLSHYNLLRKISEMKNNYKYHVILEDDFLILDPENSIIRLEKVLNYIEDNDIDFNILYLGCNFSTRNDFEVINENLLKCNKGCGFTTHAMIFKKSNIDKIIKKIESSEKEIDNVYTQLEKRYVIFPMIAIQREDVSNIGSHKNNHLLNDNKIFYGDFNKKFIYDKVNKFINLQMNK